MYPLKINEKYDQNDLENLSNRFTVPYLGNYISGNFKEYTGSHPGVDIIPIQEHQEVLSVLDAVVHKIGEDGAYGKYVFLEHKGALSPDNFSSTTTLYSCYEHLSEIKVKVGDEIKEGDVIGKTGSTGNSFGEHLHFQIDKEEAPFHAYWPFTGAEAIAAGQSFSGGVNIGLGLDKAKLYTINPLVYLNKLEEVKKNGAVAETKKETLVIETKVVETSKELKEEVKNDEPVVLAGNTVEIDNVVLSNTEEVKKSESKVEESKKNSTKEEKVKLVTSDVEDIVLTDPSAKILSSLETDNKKKIFKI